MTKGKKLTPRERRARLADNVTERCKIFKGLCDHVRCGFSLDCFSDLSLSSIEECMKLYPQEFIREDLEDAMRQGKVYWESVGRAQADGSCLGNSRSWYYNMANRYGWREKLDVQADHKGEISVNVISYATQTHTDK